MSSFLGFLFPPVTGKKENRTSKWLADIQVRHQIWAAVDELEMQQKRRNRSFHCFIHLKQEISSSRGKNTGFNWEKLIGLNITFKKKYTF